MRSGAGYKLADEAPVEGAPEAPPTAPEKEKLVPPPPKVPKGYENAPAVRDQFVDPRLSHSFRMGPVEVGQFNLGIPEQLLAYQNVTADSHPAEHPKLCIYHLEREFDKNSGSFVVLVEYARVWYDQITKA